MTAETLCAHGVPDDDPCEPCEDYARRFSNLFEAPGTIVVLAPASWADGAADLLERALYLSSMTVEDADSVKAAIKKKIAVTIVFPINKKDRQETTIGKPFHFLWHRKRHGLISSDRITQVC